MGPALSRRRKRQDEDYDTLDGCFERETGSLKRSNGVRRRNWRWSKASQDETLVKSVEHENTCSSRIAYMIEAYLPLLQELVNARHLLPHLNFIEASALCETNSVHFTVQRLFEMINTVDEPGKWQAFIHALEHEGYGYLSSLLKGETEVDHMINRMLLKLFTPALMHRIIPNEFVDHLFEMQALTDRDREEIERESINRGAIAAACIVLERVPRRHANWYSILMQALHKCGMGDIAEQFNIPFQTETDKPPLPNSNPPQLPPGSSKSSLKNTSQEHSQMKTTPVVLCSRCQSIVDLDDDTSSKEKNDAPGACSEVGSFSCESDSCSKSNGDDVAPFCKPGNAIDAIPCNGMVASHIEGSRPTSTNIDSDVEEDYVEPNVLDEHVYDLDEPENAGVNICHTDTIDETRNLVNNDGAFNYDNPTYYDYLDEDLDTLPTRERRKIHSIAKTKTGQCNSQTTLSITVEPDECGSIRVSKREVHALLCNQATMQQAILQLTQKICSMEKLFAASKHPSKYTEPLENNYIAVRPENRAFESES